MANVLFGIHAQLSFELSEAFLDFLLTSFCFFNYIHLSLIYFNFYVFGRPIVIYFYRLLINLKMIKKSDNKEFEIQFKSLRDENNKTSDITADQEEWKYQVASVVHQFELLNNESIILDSYKKVRSALLIFNIVFGLTALLFCIIEYFDLNDRDHIRPDHYQYADSFSTGAIYISIVHMLIAMLIIIIWELKSTFFLKLQFFSLTYPSHKIW